MKIADLGPMVGLNASGSSAKSEKSSFADYLKEALQQVEGLQSEARHQAQELMSGDAQQIHQAMIAYEKAFLAFSLTMEIRNKVVEAYHEIMRIQM